MRKSMIFLTAVFCLLLTRCYSPKGEVKEVNLNNDLTQIIDQYMKTYSFDTIYLKTNSDSELLIESISRDSISESKYDKNNLSEGLAFDILLNLDDSIRSQIDKIDVYITQENTTLWGGTKSHSDIFSHYISDDKKSFR